MLSPNDQIDMTDPYQNVTWYHVDRMTVTLLLSPLPPPNPEPLPPYEPWPEPAEPTIAIELKWPYYFPEIKYDYNLPPYFNSTWHEVWPIYSKIYNLTSWMEDPLKPTWKLDPCDVVDLTDINTGEVTWWHVEDIATDLILREKIMDPKCTWWHEIYPEYCSWHHLTSWEDFGWPEGMLSPSDQIDMVEEESGITTWYHVDRVTVTLNVTSESDPTEWMKIELKTHYFEEMYEVFKYPWFSLWHEVYPRYSNVYNLTDWDPWVDDNCNFVLDPCDYIWLQNMTSGDLTAKPERWHIEDMTYDLILNKKISDPVCTDWHALYPPEEYCNWYHIDAWVDTQPEGEIGHGLLSPCDNVNLTLQPSGPKEEYHVENVTLTLNVSSLDYPGEFMLIEAVTSFEEMYLPKTEPWAVDWHEVWPIFSPLYYIEPDGWKDNCNGVLDYCDNVTLLDATGFPTKWHVEEVAVDMVVKKTPELVHDVAVINVFSLLPWVYQGAIDPINVTVTNPGDFNELTVDVYAFYDGIQAAPKQTTSLNIGETKTLTFNWDTTGVPPGFYTVSANATIPIDDVPGNNYLPGNVQEVKERPPPPPMYWKANYPDYAPSGVPDFNQRQDAWNPTGLWTWCVPTAVANSLWWMDSRYETSTTPPPTISNTFNLVSNYTPGIDDHDPLNVQPFIQHLAYLMDTDGQRTGIVHAGTKVVDAQTGIAQYLSWTGLNPQGDCNGDGVVDGTDLSIVSAALGSNVTAGVPSPGWNMAADIWPVTTGWPNVVPADNSVDANDLALVMAGSGVGMFYEKTVKNPNFTFIEEEVERSEDVILMLDFYNLQWEKTYDPLKELGHAVTVAGVNSTSQPPRIAISDPDNDNAEPPPQGTSGPGRVLPPPPHPHPPGPPDTVHNNASYVSHDIYNVTFIAPPPFISNASWALQGYPGPMGYPIATVEWAVIVSPIEVVEVCGVNITDVVPHFKGVPINAGYQTWTINVNVTVHNNGTTPCNITVNLYYYNVTTWILIGTQTTTTMYPCNTTTLTFNWNLAGVPICNLYTLKANASCVCGASDEFVDGQVKVRRYCDVNGDTAVNSLDVKIVKQVYSGWVVNPFADVNGDCTTNSLDVKIVKQVYSGWIPSPPCP